LPLAIFLGLGFLTYLAEARWPLRRYSTPKALRLDLSGYAVTVLARIANEKIFFCTGVIACIRHFNHANLSWRLGFLGSLFVTPRYHFVHHGAAARLNGSNFGFLLTIWDRMFGTYVSPAGLPNDFPLGLNYRVGAARMWIGLPPGRPSEG
jgi:hypothetical protein